MRDYDAVGDCEHVYGDANVDDAVHNDHHDNPE